jgi:hypothetical protein
MCPNELDGDKMQRKPLLWKYWIAIAIAVLGTFYIYAIYAARSLHIALSPITKEDRQKFAALAKILDTAERYPHREVDNTSVGFPAIEHQLHVVGQLVDVFQLKFGRLPASIDELIALPEDGSRQEQAKEEIRSESRNCRVFDLSAESYFLNCDGWSPNEKTLQDLNVAADKRYVRFYNFDGHVVLFAPPPYVTRP